MSSLDRKKYQIAMKDLQHQQTTELYGISTWKSLPLCSTVVTISPFPSYKTTVTAEREEREDDLVRIGFPEKGKPKKGMEREIN